MCNTTETAYPEQGHLFQVFQSNVYPTAFIERAMNPKQTSTKAKQAAPIGTISIPHISTSERISLRWGYPGCIQEESNHEIPPYESQTATIPNEIQRGDLLNTVPQLCYIGETERTLITRLKNINDIASMDTQIKLWLHYTHHCIDWDSSSIISGKIDLSNTESKRHSISGR